MRNYSARGQLKDTLGLDSFDYVDLVVTVESNFGIKLVEEISLGSYISKFLDLIENKVKAKHNP